MNFKEAYQRAKSISIKGSIVVPKGYKGETNIIIPDEIVKYCAKKYNLLQNGKKVIDPMCGVGTIPRVINELGGDCIGCEIEMERHLIAASNTNGEILKGDFLTATIVIGKYDCIFTSMPFVWFKDLKAIEKLDSSYVKRFHEILKPSGIILIDSLPIVERNGEIWKVSEMQNEYFSRNGFTLTEITTFETEEHVDTSSKSVIMKFEKEF
ncbi:MAG TPA: class I SAM-dependent methyltransferase [Candidatus Woesebacteria bacterium]|nr:class I SAM-dependent methyltransferase [Candidatus Woesebacteria bacterium]